MAKLRVKYNGPNIFLYNDYSVNDLTVKLDDVLLERNEFKVSSTRINKIGVNYFTLTELKSGNNNTARFIVIGTRVVLDIRARYVGPEMPVSDRVDPNDIIVEMDTVDQNNENLITILLKYNEDVIILEDGTEVTDEYYIKYPDFLVTDVGDNIRTIVYKDPTIQWEGEIVIPGIPKIIKFETKYTGDTRIVGSVISKGEVRAELTTLYNYYTNEIKTEEVPSEDWSFYDTPIITEDNKGVIKTKHISGAYATVTVPFTNSDTLRLRCWYEGVKIEVGNQFNKHDVVAYMIDENGIVYRVYTTDIDFIDETIINEDGWNFYKLRLKNPKYEKIIGTYAVPGYIPLEVEDDVEFKMVYVDERNDFRQVDYTMHFKNFLMFEDYLYIGWDTVLDAIIELGLYGRYILTAPKKHGLSNKYDQDWEVLCINRDSIKAHVLKNYYKEENETWQQRKQLQQTRKKWWKIPNET